MTIPEAIFFDTADRRYYYVLAPVKTVNLQTHM